MDDLLSMYLMCEDTIVMIINIYDKQYDVVTPELLPWSLKGAIKPVPEYSSALTVEERKKHDRIRDYTADLNRDALDRWLADRALSLSRKNAKWVYNLLRIEQLQDTRSKARVSILCRSVSLLDNYWIKLENDPVTWEQVNLRHNPLNEVIAQVALHGSSLTLQGSLTTPELTTNGAYAKAWRRYKTGNLWLHKAGSTTPDESKIEVMCSVLLDKMNVSHCYYKITEDEDLVVCACPCMTTDDLSIVDYLSIYSFCCRNNLEPDKYVLDLDAPSIYKMTIVDYLFSNRDRHGQNWGFYFDPHSTQIRGCHPLFDHNNAFDRDYMLDRDALYLYNSKSIRESAKLAANKVDFHFEFPITRKDFLTTRQYEEFTWRANDLGVQIIENKVWAQYRKLCGYNTIEESDEEFKRLHDLFQLPDSSNFYPMVSAYAGHGLSYIKAYMTKENLVTGGLQGAIAKLSKLCPEAEAKERKLNNDFTRAVYTAKVLTK